MLMFNVNILRVWAKVPEEVRKMPLTSFLEVSEFP